ncbi:MAG: DNA adenine methylase [Cyanobacteria bacterium J06592_8]
MIQQFNQLSTLEKKAKPFLKWAGGKGKLLEQISTFLPPELSAGKIKRYIEPFVGSGAVFIYLSQLYPIDEYYIFDINPELILAYNTIKTDVNQLIERLETIQSQYFSLDPDRRKEYYYETRTRFNQNRRGINFDKYSETWIKRTSQLIFLNRTCFNGLFRVNSKGDFNVPMGRYKNPLINNAKNLVKISKLLQKTQIILGDFMACDQWVDAETFVYFDPPYKPISNTSAFTSYSQQRFDDAEQLRLRDLFVKLDRKQAKLMLSNSDPKNEDVNNNFFEDAYQGYRIERVKASRNINSKATKRGKIDELVIMNYETRV